jgi:hypothetical protein
MKNYYLFLVCKPGNHLSYKQIIFYGLTLKCERKCLEAMESCRKVNSGRLHTSRVDERAKN